jgi:ATP-binding cassette, subfamily B, bacterial HlyB/CyaB
MLHTDTQTTAFLSQLFATYPFCDLPEKVQQHLTVQLQSRAFQPGEIIYPEQEIPSEIHYIVRGKVRLLGSATYQSPTLAIANAGTVIGWDSLLRRLAPGSARAAISTDTVDQVDQPILTLSLAADEFEAIALKYLVPRPNQPASLTELFDTLSCFLAAMPNYFSEVNLKEMVRYIEQEQLAIVQNWFPNRQQPGELLHQLSEHRVWLVSGGAAINVPVGTPINLPKGLHQVRPSLFPVRLLGIDRAFLASAILSGSMPHVSGTVESAIDLRLLPGAPELSEPIPTKSYPIKQSTHPTQVEDLVACFEMVCRVLKVPYRPDSLRRQLQQRSLDQFEPLDLCLRIAQAIGLEARIIRVTPTLSGFDRLSAPALIHCRGILTVFHGVTGKTVTLGSPRSGLLRLSASELTSRFVSDQQAVCHAVVLERSPQTPIKKFGFGWFLPILSKQRGILFQVFIASAFVQILGLANPLLVQQVIDKVIISANPGTMPTFGFLLILFAALEGVLTVLRTYLFSGTTLRLDLRLGTEVVRHLLRLPLNFFEKRPVGELSARLSELEKIRQFLTGTALTAVLDIVFSLLYVAVMLLYSVQLTVCVLLSLPVIMLSTVLVATIQKRLIRVRSDHGAQVQSHLIEMLSGMFTVKAQHLEELAESTWRDRYIKYLSSGFTHSTVSTIFGSFTQFLNSASGFWVLWVGAGLVLEGKLTLGGLIAFRILSGSVTGPFIRLARLWQQVQETSLSMELLADIVESPLEASPHKDDAYLRLPELSGQVEYRNVCFGFKPDQQQLVNINLEIPSGAFVGIVGQSGSGKSTLVKLLPRLYQPQSGSIYIDGFDVNKVKLHSLREQIGYVPQDPALFEGTIRDNISLGQELDDDSIVLAAKVAEAHAFIMQLPEGYNTTVGERGGSLSGGQRQRIAIARIIATNPRLLIFDEATSALDAATERQVCRNLRSHLRGRTVLFITHRLHTIANADRILYLEAGAVVEQGTHAELMAMRQRYYSLFNQIL